MKDNIILMKFKMKATAILNLFPVAIFADFTLLLSTAIQNFVPISQSTTEL